MGRLLLTDAQWAKLEPHCLGKPTDPGRSGRNNRLFLEAVLCGAKVVISQHPGRAQKLKIDAEIDKWRHLIENFFCKLKEFKRIAMRACKTDQSFSAMIYLAAAVINSR